MKNVPVYCPLCDSIWIINLEEESDIDIYEEGAQLICPDCTHSENDKQNGSFRIKENTEVDIYPGDA